MFEDWLIRHFWKVVFFFYVLVIIVILRRFV